MKRTILTLITVIGLFLAFNASSANSAPCPLPNDNNAILDLLWPWLDTNRDGGISLSEISVIYPIPENYFNMFDTNRDGKIDRQEFQPLLALIAIYLPGGLLSLVDTNGDSLIQYEEVASYLTKEQFNAIDRNRNGVIDCEDLKEPPIDIEGEPCEGEGEIIIEGEYNPPETDPCDWVGTVIAQFDDLDQNGDGVLTRDEINFPIIMIYPPIVDFDVLFDALDLDDNGEVTMEELETWAEICGEIVIDEPCPLPPIPARMVLELLLPLVDSNGDDKLSKDEIRSLYPEIDNLLAEYNLSLDIVFFMIDTNRDSGVDVDELEGILRIFGPQFGLDPDNILSLIDTNGDSLVSYDEVADYVDKEQFSYVDFNGNGVIDCEDYAFILSWIDGGWDWEGEVIPLDPCALGPIILEYFRFLDSNGDGQITRDDLITILPVEYPIPVDQGSLDEIFAFFDIDANGGITADEVQTIIDSWCNIVIEGEPIPIEGEIDLPIDPCAVAPLVLQYFDYIDRNRDGQITLDEVTGPVIMIYPSPLPIDQEWIMTVFKKFDLDGNGGVTKDELQSIVENCKPVPVEGELPPIEGEIDVPDVWNPCSIAPLAMRLFDQLDTNGDGVISVDDLVVPMGSLIYPRPIPANLADILSLFDLDGDLGISKDELQAIIDKCSSIVIPWYGPEGEGNVGPGGQPEDGSGIVLERRIMGGRRFTPGQVLTVQLKLNNPSNLTLSALGLNEVLPSGWTLQSVISSAGAGVNISENIIQFVWLNVPEFPVQITYTVLAPQDALNEAIFSGQAIYRTLTSGELTSSVVETILYKLLGREFAHSADSDGDWRFSLSELLRVIQFFNSGGYGCDENSEDGYAPGNNSPKTCRHHSADFRVKDWKIDLSELLRTIQLFNALGYTVQEGTEDGFAPLI